MQPNYLHIGGLIAVGFDPAESYLLAISHSGRGVFCTNTWQKVARDTELAFPEDGHGFGIGPISGMKIPVIEMYWQTYSERQIVSPSGRFQLHCESSGIAATELAAD